MKWKVFFRNQAVIHSNALVYIDKINRGVSTDSSGYYTIMITENDCENNEELKLIYFLNDFDMDSAKVVLVDGQIKEDTLDVGIEGIIKTKELNQITLIEGWTDKDQYSIGDSVDFTTRITNLSNRVIHIFINSCGGQLSNFVFLYNDRYASFQLGGEQNVLTLDCDIYLQPNEFYNGILVTNNSHTFDCRIYSGPSLEDRLLTNLKAFLRYVIEEWYKILSPTLTSQPN